VSCFGEIAEIAVLVSIAIAIAMAVALVAAVLAVMDLEIHQS
jgi:hypothetical protein